MKILLAMLLLAGLATPAYTESLNGLCLVSASQHEDAAEVLFQSSDCRDDRGNCSSSSNSNMPWSRWTGLSAAALKQDGTKADAHLTGDAGDLRCSGTIHDGLLTGRYEFTPNPAFVASMSAMGFTEITPRKQQGFLMLDVNLAWVRQMKDAGITELTTNKLMGLRALHVDPAYVRAMADAGYTELRAGKLTEMKAVGVTPEKARDAKALGFQPTEQELIQMSIFKIDRPFIEKMRSRGLTDLTLAKLIKIKIFKVDE